MRTLQVVVIVIGLVAFFAVGYSLDWDHEGNTWRLLPLAVAVGLIEIRIQRGRWRVR